MRLTIEIVPQTCWYTNVRSEVSEEEWCFIRTTCYKRADYKCEICGDTGKNQGYEHNVECHEIWEYDDDEGIQKLTGFTALCPKCHKVKHIGHARITGDYDMCIKHLRKINKWNKRKTDKYLEEIHETFMQRSQYDWKLDIKYIDTYGVNDILDSMLKKFKKK